MVVNSLKHHAHLFNRHANGQVQEIMLNGGEEYGNGNKKLSPSSVKAHTAGSYTSEVNECAERTICTASPAGETMLSHPGTPANLSVE